MYFLLKNRWQVQNNASHSDVLFKYIMCLEHKHLLFSPALPVLFPSQQYYLDFHVIYVYKQMCNICIVEMPHPTQSQHSLPHLYWLKAFII